MSHFKAHSVLPGFNLALGFTLLYLSLIVLIPLSALFFKTATLGWGGFWDVATGDRVLASLRVTFFTSFAAAVINVIFGLIVAWVLVRYKFPGKRIVDALVDLPFALPTAVAGITLATLYAPNGWLGQYFAEYGIKVAYTPLGIVIALTFIGLPFVVRTVQPVLADVEAEVEEAAASLGAGRLDVFRRVIFPGALPSIFVGVRFALGIMWLTLIVAETIAASSGLGYMAMQAREFMLIDVVVLSILIYALLGKLADSASHVLERLTLSWHPAFQKR